MRGESASFHTPREHHNAILVLQAASVYVHRSDIHYSSPTHPFTFVMLSIRVASISVNIQRNEGCVGDDVVKYGVHPIVARDDVERDEIEKRIFTNTRRYATSPFETP